MAGKKRKSNAGRPAKIDGLILRILEDAFRRGLSDEMACLTADIATATLYEYQKSNPEFTERKKLLKQNIKMRARELIADRIEHGDHDTAKWLLERRDDAFKPKSKQELNATVGLSLAENIRAARDRAESPTAAVEDAHDGDD